MTYRELIDLYKNGKLNEEQKAKVEKDIERQEAISEYLFDEGEIPGLEDLGNQHSDYAYGVNDAEENQDLDKLDEEQKKFAKMIRTSIRRAFIKMGVTVGAVVIVVVLFIIFALPKLVDCMYYNPLEVAGSEKVYDSYSVADEDGNIVETVTSDEEYEIHTTDRLTLDISVYSELFLPGRYISSTISDARGYGEYDVVISRSNQSIAGKVDKNKLVMYDADALRRPSVNYFVPTEAGVEYAFMDEGAYGSYGYMLEMIQDLDEDEYYGAYVTFSDVYSYGEFEQWCKENETVQPYWCAICEKIDEEYQDNYDGRKYYAGDLYGFVYASSAWKLYFDKEKYPNLTQYELSLTTSEEKDWSITEEDMTTHVLSMLRYMQDQKTFNKMMGTDYCETENVQNTYHDWIDSVEKDGLNIYGFYCVANREEMLELLEVEEIAYIYAETLED